MKVSELLSNESKWTKDTQARNKDNVPVRFDDPSAVCWCLLGAIAKCYDKCESLEIRNRLREFLPHPCINRFNDNHSYEEVMEVVRQADI